MDTTVPSSLAQAGGSVGRALAGLPDSVNSWAGGRVRGWERGQRAGRFSDAAS